MISSNIKVFYLGANRPKFNSIDKAWLVLKEKLDKIFNSERTVLMG